MFGDPVSLSLAKDRVGGILQSVCVLLCLSIVVLKLLYCRFFSTSKFSRDLIFAICVLHKIKFHFILPFLRKIVHVLINGRNLKRKDS